MGDYRGPLDNGEWMTRAQRGPDPSSFDKLRMRGAQDEDTTGLRMLEEFLTKRKGARDGNERK